MRTIESSTTARGTLARSLLSTAVAVFACACSGTSDEGSAPGEFEEMTLVTYPGFGPGSPSGSSCDSWTYPETRHVDAASQAMSWDRCGPPPGETLYEPRQGTRPLTDGELELVLDLLDGVTPSDSMSCGADASVITLDLTTTTGTTLYANDFYSGCPWEVHRGRTFAHGLEELSNGVNGLPID